MPFAAKVNLGLPQIQARNESTSDYDELLRERDATSDASKTQLGLIGS
jgi:hypothetical protein